MNNIISLADARFALKLCRHNRFDLFAAITIPAARSRDLQRFARINNQYTIYQFTLTGSQQQRRREYDIRTASIRQLPTNFLVNQRM